MSCRMFQLTLAALLAAAVLALPIESAHARAASNPFAGSWHGGFTTDIQAWGYVSWTIADNGLLTGAATYYPAGVSGTLTGHVNQSGFGAFIFHSPPQVIPYLLYVSINGDGEMEVVAPTPWSGGFTIFATLQPQ